MTSPTTDPTPEVEVVVQTPMPGWAFGERLVLTATPFVLALLAGGRLMTGAAYDAALAQVAAGAAVAVTDVTAELAAAEQGTDAAPQDGDAEAAQAAADADPAAGDTVV